MGLHVASQQGVWCQVLALCLCLQLSGTVRAWRLHSQAQAAIAQQRAHLQEAAEASLGWGWCSGPQHRVTSPAWLAPPRVTCSAALQDAALPLHCTPHKAGPHSGLRSCVCSPLPSGPAMPILQRRHLAVCQHKRAMYMHSLVLQFPLLFERLSEGFFDKEIGGADWDEELRETMKLTLRDPQGYLDLHRSGQERAERFLADSHEGWDLPPMAEVSWQLQALAGRLLHAHGRSVHQSLAAGASLCLTFPAAL